MIETLRGKIIKKNPSYTIIDVHDIGFKINTTINCYEKLPDLKNKITLLIYFHITENKFDLYGFLDETERDLFMMLIGISGIGPKTAINMLSAVPPSDFKNRLIAGEVKMLTSLPGIGPKTARRIIVELKDKFGDFDKDELPLEDTPMDNDAFQALKSLGFTPSIIKEVINKVLLKNNNLNTEDIIKESLKILK
tara:strand:+ start:47 stop:628 length:582 start_codon:yes stop_codon:yes gene_type:complete